MTYLLAALTNLIDNIQLRIEAERHFMKDMDRKPIALPRVRRSPVAMRSRDGFAQVSTYPLDSNNLTRRANHF
jgi:hypothetical protein